ncbi:MAG: RES domain-containing protein [Eubacteriales bacterium]|nr:RES domain-containing protein [Eubacteriales bacterium]
MIKDDRIYQVLLRHDFDLFRGNKEISEYLREHLDKYYNDISIAAKTDNSFLGGTFTNLIEGKLETLRDFCTTIPEVLTAYENGYIKDAYVKSAKLFDQIKPYFLFCNSSSNTGGKYYRIRSGDYRIKEVSESKAKKAELFHIKKPLRSRIGAYRYSVPGYPCLYLASDIELAWFECGMPKQFSYCQMNIMQGDASALKLVDISHRPVEFLSGFTTYLLNARRRGKSEDELRRIYDVLINYILTYPLASACSVKVKNRSEQFVEEYIFPQLFMSWIRESEDIDGIQYKSSLYSTLVQGIGAVNLALPVKTFREDGLDEKLSAKIEVSDIGFFDVSDQFKQYKCVLHEIDEFKNSLQTFIVESPYVGSYVLELIDLCEYIKRTYNALIEGDYSNGELTFTSIDRLSDYANLLYKCKEIKIEEYIREFSCDETHKSNLPIIDEQFEKFHMLTGKILRKHVAFGFNFENLSNFETI